MEAILHEESIDIAAPAEAVYDLVSDVTRMGEWSPETYKCEWLDGATGPAVGARFKGSNRQGLAVWSTVPRVVACDRGREFTFVTTLGGRDLVRWSYRFAPTDIGVRVTESATRVGEVPGLRGVFVKLFFSDSRRVPAVQAGIRETLTRLKAAAESAAA